MRHCLLLLVAACGNPDNLVIGGVGADTTNNIPVAVINGVHSAVSAIGTRTDPNGNKTQSTVVVLSNTPGLCDQLGAHPDYFRKPPEAYVALILYTPLDRVGTFFLVSDKGTFGELIAANPGPSVTPYFTVATGSTYIAVSDVATDGSNARGGFDLLFLDLLNQPHELYGRFKVGSCAALASALLP